MLHWGTIKALVKTWGKVDKDDFWNVIYKIKTAFMGVQQPHRFLIYVTKKLLLFWCIKVLPSQCQLALKLRLRLQPNMEVWIKKDIMK